MTPQMMGLSSEPLQGAISHSAALAGYALLVLCFGLVVIAAFDVPFQHLAALARSQDDARGSQRGIQGKRRLAETRGRIREAQRALARGRMMQEVPKADVVITNPTHYAVALRYDEAQSRAYCGRQGFGPARRQDSRDRHRKRRAARRRAAAGARALSQRRAGHEVPAALYVTVAQVLTYVYQLKAAVARGAKPPPPPVIH
jgi:flagellar biosynthetic protein FlhB